MIMTNSEEVDKRREQLIELLGQGNTERECARLLDVSEKTVWNDVRALRNDPKWFNERINNLFDRILNEMDLKNAQDRRCVFSNICRLLAKTLPENVKLSGSVEQRLVMIKGEFCRMGPDGKPNPINSVEVSSSPPAA
jgi:hypothetical protein